MKILGIDPGTIRIGYGIVDVQKRGVLRCEYFGLFDISQENALGNQLCSLAEQLKKLVEVHKPERVGVEKIFFKKNVSTAVSVAHARGVILATIASFPGLELIEISPAEVKAAVTGNGTASKSEVAKMVRLLTKASKDVLIDDVSDAIAIAIAVSGNGVG